MKGASSPLKSQTWLRQKELGSWRSQTHARENNVVMSKAAVTGILIHPFHIVTKLRNGSAENPRNHVLPLTEAKCLAGNRIFDVLPPYENPAQPRIKGFSTHQPVSPSSLVPLNFKSLWVWLGSCLRHKPGQDGSQEPTPNDAGGPRDPRGGRSGWFPSPAKMGHLRATTPSSQRLNGVWDKQPLRGLTLVPTLAAMHHR